MHSALVSAQSSAFARFVNGAFREAGEFHAELESVSEETFVLFAQYAYTGNYELLGIESKAPVNTETALRPHASRPEPEPEPEPEQEVDLWGFSSTSKKKKEKGVAIEPEEPQALYQYRYDRDALWKEFRDVCSIAIDVETRPSAVSHNSNIILSHARLYVFADCYDMSKLADRSFDKLGQALLKLDVTSEAVTDIIELIRYVYDEPAPERLQNHLALYAACKAGELWADTKFRGLVAAHADLAVAILGVMIEGRVTN
jgi:hypothetical protein